jgi:hypothetical protein
MPIETEHVKAPDPSPIGSQRFLGRLPAIDERSRYARYAMAAPPTTRTFRNWLSPRWQQWPRVLDQGSTSECVAYSANKFLLTHPIVNRPRDTCNELYRRAQQVDEWPGDNYDGTSVNAGMKVLRTDGLITGWTWAYEVKPIVRHILEIGPVVLGTDWTNRMYYPGTNGYIWPEGIIEGGHAYLLVCVNTLRNNPDGTVGAVRVLNSWGERWGQNGRAWMTFDVLAKLLQGLDRWPGEAAAPIEAQLPR